MTFKRILSTALCVALCLSVAEAKKKTSAKTTEERPTVCVWNFDKMVEAHADIRKNGDRSQYKASYDRLIRDADKILPDTPTTVMDGLDKRQISPGMVGATAHDFMNSSKYVWPDGKGWLASDEKRGVNTDWRLYSSTPQGVMQRRVVTLGLAWFFTGDEKYAHKAIDLAHAWYLDPTTRMNPNYQYGVVIPVKDTPGKFTTNFAGLIFSHEQLYAMAGLSLIRGSKAYTPEFDKGMRAWASELYRWMLTHEYGKVEDNSRNNHAVAYDQTMLALALFTGDRSEAERIVGAFPERRIFTHIEPNGEMPRETARESGFQYSQYNLWHFVEFCDMAMEINPRLYYANKDGRSIDAALKFLLPFLDKPLEDWLATTGKAGKNFKEYTSGIYEYSQVNIARIAYRAASFSPGNGYMEAFERFRSQIESDPRYSKYAFHLAPGSILYITK